MQGEGSWCDALSYLLHCNQSVCDRILILSRLYRCRKKLSVDVFI